MGIEELNTLKSQLPAILVDYQKYYVLSKLHPENAEYQQIFQNIQSNLNDINSKLFILSNDVQSNTNKINAHLLSLNESIKDEKAKNKNLKSQLNIVENNNNASTELITNYMEMYDSGYLRNWALFLSILIVGTLITKNFKNSGIKNQGVNKIA
jgi:chromosome segregation ATPase